MPKIKTRKTVSKRFYTTGSGKILRTKIGKSHLRRKKSPQVKRTFRQKLPLNKSSLPKVRQMLGGNL